MVSVIESSAPMAMKAFRSAGAAPLAAVAASASPGKVQKPTIRLPPAAAATLRKPRRPAISGAFISGSFQQWRLGGILDRLADAGVGTASADVAGHGVVDLGVGRLVVLGQQRSGRHDLA